MTKTGSKHNIPRMVRSHDVALDREYADSTSLRENRTERSPHGLNGATAILKKKLHQLGA